MPPLTALRYAFVVIVAVGKPAFATSFQIHLAFLLPFFGHDIDQATGTAAAVERGGAGDDFNAGDNKWIDRVQLAAVAARGV